MSSQSFDPVQHKEKRRREWNSVASAWLKWWDTFEHGAQTLSDRLIQLAEIIPGHKVLDVATGIGEPALTAARQVGPTGRVVAIDLSAEMLVKARERAAAQGLQNVEFHEMDAERLDFPEAAFDAILCRIALFELADLPTALGRMRRLLAPGGRLATAVWDKPDNVPFLGQPMKVLRQMFDVPPPPPGTPSPFSLADTSILEQALSEAGFDQVSSKHQTVVFEFPSFDTYRNFIEEVSPAVQEVLDGLPAERKAEAWQAIAETLDEYVEADGRLQIPNGTFCVVAQR